MGVIIGVAPDAWGIWFADDPKQLPWPRMLDEMVEAGYRWMELGPYGYLPTESGTLRRELEDRGLSLCACVVEGNLEDTGAWPALEHQLVGGAEKTAALDGRFVVLIDDVYSGEDIGTPKAPARLEDGDWARLIDTVHRVARLAHDRWGLELAFHPNADTHVEYEEQIERLLAETDPELVSLCLDTGHHTYRGGDPVDFMRRHHKRISHLHLKSVDRQKLQRVQSEQLTFTQAVAEGVFCEPARGIVDFPALRDLLVEVDYDGFAMVEQDMYPAPFDQPLPIAARSRDYYASINFGTF
jgi:inosose dehydratase